MKADNRTERKLINAQVAIGDYIVSLGDLPANETKTMTISRGQGTSLKNFVSMHAQGFQSAVSSRQRAFGQTESGRITDLPNGSIAASFLSQLGGQVNQPGYMNNFIVPAGLDLSSVVEHGNAVLFAWDTDYSPAKSMCKFSPRRSHRDTLWRVAANIK